MSGPGNSTNAASIKLSGLIFSKSTNLNDSRCDMYVRSNYKWLKLCLRSGVLSFFARTLLAVTLFLFVRNVQMAYKRTQRRIYFPFAPLLQSQI